MGLILSKIIILDKNLIIFGDAKGFLDANKEYNLLKNNISDMRCVYIDKTRFSIKQMISVMFAKYYVYSCYPGDISAVFFHGKILLNVWHGMPIKNIESAGTIESYQKEYYLANILSHKLTKQTYFFLPDTRMEHKFRKAFKHRVKNFVNIPTERYGTQRDDLRFQGQGKGCLIIWSSFLKNRSDAFDIINSLESCLLSRHEFVLHSFHPINKYKFKNFFRILETKKIAEIPENVYIYESSMIYQAGINVTLVTPKKMEYELDDKSFEKIRETSEFIFWNLKNASCFTPLTHDEKISRWKNLIEGGK